MIPAPEQFRDLWSKFNNERDRFPRLSHSRIMFPDPQNLGIEALRQDGSWPNWKHLFQKEMRHRIYGCLMGNFAKKRNDIPPIRPADEVRPWHRLEDSVRVIHFLHSPWDVEDIVDRANAKRIQREFMVLAENAIELFRSQKNCIGVSAEQLLPMEWLIETATTTICGDLWLIFLQEWMHPDRYSRFIHNEIREPVMTTVNDVFLQSSSICANLANNIEEESRKMRERCIEREREEATRAGESKACEKNEDPKEPLEVRVAKEIRRDPNIDSIRLGKLVGANGGVVRGTTAWKNRKQLRSDMPKQSTPYTKTDTSGGYSDTGIRRDIAPTVNEPKEHHLDINEMIKGFQNSKRKKYPTVEEIANKLSSKDEHVSIPTAKQWLKETESIFGYEHE